MRPPGRDPAARAGVETLRRSDTAQAAGLAVATIAQQLMAVVFTIVFTRILGTDGYGSLAALINLTVILLVPGSALQVVAARQGTLGRLGRGGELAATLDRWTRHILARARRASTVVSVARRASRWRRSSTSTRSGRPPPCRSCAALWLLISRPARAAAGHARLPAGRATR